MPCLDGAAICDTLAFRCYAFDGRCTQREDCPYYDEYWDKHGIVTCTAGYCSIAPKPAGPLAGLLANGVVVVSAPLIGQVFASEDDISIVWSWPGTSAGASVIVVIMDGIPQSKDDLGRKAVWGAALDRSQGDIRIGDGYQIEQTSLGPRWTEHMGGALPRNQVLTLAVQVVQRGELLAVSAVIPFSVGGAWPARGTPCNPTLGPAQCTNPGEALDCDPASATCERVCGGYRDCLDLVPAHDCGIPRGHARYCE